MMVTSVMLATFSSKLDMVETMSIITMSAELRLLIVTMDVLPKVGPSGRGLQKLTAKKRSFSSECPFTPQKIRLLPSTENNCRFFGVTNEETRGSATKKKETTSQHIQQNCLLSITFRAIFCVFYVFLREFISKEHHVCPYFFLSRMVMCSNGVIFPSYVEPTDGVFFFAHV